MVGLMGKLGMPVILALRRKRQKDCHKCKDSLGYLRHSRPARSSYEDPVSKKQNKLIKKKSSRQKKKKVLGLHQSGVEDYGSSVVS